MSEQSLKASGVENVFSADGRAYGIDDILLAADFRGDLQRLRVAWLSSFSEIQKNEEEGVEPDEAALDKQADDFRYARNLVTADECEQWLAALGLTTDDFAEHIARRCRLTPDLFANQNAEFDPQNAFALDAGLARAFRIDLLLSDHFQPLASALAWRAAVLAEKPERPSAEEMAAQKAQGIENLRSAWRTEREDSPPPTVPENRLDELAAMEALFQSQIQTILIPENQRRALAALRLPLINFELEILELESEAAAREAFLCLKEDGISLEELAAESRLSIRKTGRFLEEFPQDWQRALLSAVPGAPLAPFASGEGFQICRLIAKRDPALSDPAVLQRVNTSLLRSHFGELENRHVRWHVNLEIEAS